MTAHRPSAASRFALRFIATYRAEISGRRGHTCGSTPTCSEYGEAAFQTHGFLKATSMTLRHIASCRPSDAANANANDVAPPNHP